LSNEDLDQPRVAYKNAVDKWVDEFELKRHSRLSTTPRLHGRDGMTPTSTSKTPTTKPPPPATPIKMDFDALTSAFSGLWIWGAA